MSDNNIMVTVICACYNHENYIRSALDGFVSQKTNFAYEVIVHEDASTDNSAAIIREYELKYPDIIKPIYQTENQYSKIAGSGIEEKYIFPIVRGRYIAYCEGDDYWIDENKLQKQVDFLEQHPDFVACVHNSYYEFSSGEKHVKYKCEDKELRVEDLIVEAGEYQTSSLILRTPLLMEMPAWVTSIPRVGDYPLAIYMAMNGRIKYFGDIMSTYRVATPGSWTANYRHNTELILSTKKKTRDMLYMADEYSKFKYTDIITKKIISLEYIILKLENNLKEIKTGRCRDLYLKESLFSKIRMHIKYYSPGLLKIKRRIFDK